MSTNEVHGEFVDLSDYMTSREAITMLRFSSLNALTQPESGFADRHNVRTIMVGGTRGYNVADLFFHEFKRRKKKGDLRGTVGLFGELNRWLRDIGLEREGLLHQDFYIAQEAMNYLELSSRERLYQLSDFRGGSIRTVEFGRVRLYNAADIRERDREMQEA